MNQSMQPAIQHLFQVSSLEAVSRERLEKFVEEYPCYGFGHYLLSRKLRAENADQFLAATQKTSLYFSNPFWLQWMLENTPASEGKYSPVPEAPAPHLIPEPAPIQVEEPIYDEEPPFVLDDTDTDQTKPAPTEPILFPAETWPEMESPGIPAGTTALQADPEAPSAAAELLLESIEKARVLRESLQKINEDYQSHNGLPAPTEAAPRPVEAPIRDEEPPFVLEEPYQPPSVPEPEQPVPVPEETYQPMPAPEHDRTEPAPIVVESSSTPLADSPSPATTTETTPLFEPLHTIDYFASQGIRLTLDENPTDPLGRQLKSFTEWLRTMRRLPQKDREIVPNRVAEQAVQNFAAHSIEGKEPITETMAEVLAKQGMPERARIVYEKLSLLNPDKSAYFAAKIEQLNIH
jgi:hypothetical protein